MVMQPQPPFNHWKRQWDAVETSGSLKNDAWTAYPMNGQLMDKCWKTGCHLHRHDLQKLSNEGLPLISNFQF